MVELFLLALVLTILIETIVLFLVSIFLKYDFKVFSSKRIIFAGIFASALTLPYLYFVFPYFLWDWNTYVAIWEISVTFMEAVFYLFYFDIKFYKWFLLSFLANVTSFSIWLILF